MFAGQTAIFAYLAGVYQKFRSSLFVECRHILLIIFIAYKASEELIEKEKDLPGRTINTFFDSEISGVI